MREQTDRWVHLGVSNTPARHIGYRPLDSSEPFRAAAVARQPVLDQTNPITLYQGGGFVTKGPYD